MIDLMSDFASQGIRIVHPNKRIEKFYQNWFTRVNGKDRSERFLHNLFKTSNVVIRRQTAKIKQSDQERIYKSIAGADIEQISHMSTQNNIIPWKYVFLSLLTIEPAAGDLAIFEDKPTLKMVFPRKAKSMTGQKFSKEELKVINSLPQDIKQAILKEGSVLLDTENTLLFHYKKDDCEIWASPILEAILDDVVLLEKLRLADYAALDGATSNIRIFKLGNLEQRIMPTPTASQKLASILESHTGVGTMDLVWGPDIELIESKTNVHEFLGEEKYKPTLQAIYAGLGIPPALVGGGGTSMTNNFISLKTLIERLQYGRDVLLRFWNTEIAIVQKAMGFRFPAFIEFDFQALANEDAEKALLIQLSDRGLISDEALQQRFDMNHEMEKVRLQRESRERVKGVRVPKAGPWHDPQIDNSLKKIALQNGMVTPSQVGLMLEKNTDEDLLMFDEEKNGDVEDTNELSGIPNQGRPKNSKDKEKRKDRQVNPKTKAAIETWASFAQETISNILNPILLKSLNKNNARKLTNEESESIENIKFRVLYNISPFTNIDNQVIASVINNGFESSVLNELLSWYKNYEILVGRSIKLEEQRKIQIAFYATKKI